MTFDELVNVQPELVVIKAEAQGWRSGPERWEHYEALKARVKRLVGWKAQRRGMPKFMYTTEAFDVAVKEIFG